MAPPSLPREALICQICKGTTFSDCSHLLTHLASKQHLSAEFNARTSALNKPEFATMVRNHDAWIRRYGIDALLAQRLAAKELRMANQPSPRGKKTDSDKKSTSAKAGTKTLPALRPGADNDPLNFDKLKGPKFPGMGMFDSANAEQAKKRNQRKDAGVVQKMEQDAKNVVDRQQVWGPGLSKIVKEKSCYSPPSEHDSEDDEKKPKQKAKAPPKTPKPKAGSKRPATTRVTRPTILPPPSPPLPPLPAPRRQPNQWDDDDEDEAPGAGSNRAPIDRRQGFGGDRGTRGNAPYMPLPPRPSRPASQREDSGMYSRQSFAQSLRPPPPEPRAPLQSRNRNGFFPAAQETTKPSNEGVTMAGRQPMSAFPPRPTMMAPPATTLEPNPYSEPYIDRNGQWRPGFNSNRIPQGPPAPPAPMDNPLRLPPHPQYQPGLRYNPNTGQFEATNQEFGFNLENPFAQNPFRG